MNKLIFTVIIITILSNSNTMANNTDCTQFEKISAKYLECKAKNLKKSLK